MAAISPASASPTRPRIVPGRPARASVAARSVDGSLAVLGGAAGLILANGYPVAPSLVVGLFVAWAVFAAWRVSFALPALIALVPVAGFATWTGWLTFEEVDLLVLATAAGGYAARAMSWRTTAGSDGPRHEPQLSIFSILLLALFLASTLFALERGVDAAGGWHFGFYDGYDGALNGVRIFKSFAFALLIAPLVIDDLRRPGGFDRIGFGLTASLALASLAVLHERLSFTGLLDFSDDYRVTGSFWEMHVGGAALDGFLVLTLPFAIRDAVRHANPVRFVAAATVVGLAAYAILVTFSRGVYMAAPAGLLFLALLLSRRTGRVGRGASWSVLVRSLALTSLVAIAGFLVFRHGGYRAAAAVLAVFGLAILGDTAIRRSTAAAWIPAFAVAAVASAIGAVVGDAVPKGPYVVFVAACLATAASILQDERTSLRRWSTVVVAAWLWSVASAVQVAGFWGGAIARDDSLVVACGLIVAVFTLSRRTTATWPVQRRQRLATVGFSALVVAAVTVFTGGAYIGNRFAVSRSDLDDRIGHWSRSLDRLRGSDWLVGKGLGRFPATSIFEAVDGAGQGRYGLTTRDGESFMRLTAPHLPYLGFDELFRLSQRVSPRPHTPYTAVLLVHVDQPTGVHIELCEKQLLYKAACRIEDRDVAAAGDDWQRVAFRFDSGEIGESHWFGRRPVFFAVGVGDPRKSVDIRRMQIIGPDGDDLLANGDFRNRTARWFTQSDKYHLPWHIKNIALDVLFDQGLIGLALFAALVSGALIRTTVGRAGRHPDAPYVAAALVGYLVVGAFDSLLDVPRVAFLFYVIAIIGLALRNPPNVKASPPPPGGSTPGEPAARTLRRQRAFGERRP